MKKKIPFDFILDYLHPMDINIKPMFGCYAIYSEGKILIILRKKNDHTEANGVWIATGKVHHESLRRELPSLKSIYILSEGKGETNWQMIHEKADDFEESAVKICEMILRKDKRVGKIPNSKKRKTIE